jgi:uncharacterized protein YdiU (UPF0061 family)
VEAAALIDQALALLKDNTVDYTSFFRALSKAGRGEESLPGKAFDDWLAHWRSLGPDVEAMDRVNPVYIPRNHLVEQALSAGMRGDLAPVQKLLEVLAEPYRERDGLEAYAAPAPPEFGDYRTFCGT